LYDITINDGIDVEEATVERELEVLKELEEIGNRSEVEDLENIDGEHQGPFLEKLKSTKMVMDNKHANLSNLAEFEELGASLVTGEEDSLTDSTNEIKTHHNMTVMPTKYEEEDWMMVELKILLPGIWKKINASSTLFLTGC